jgi:muramoyltetrapeptide carboxypeptidase
MFGNGAVTSLIGSRQSRSGLCRPRPLPPGGHIRVVSPAFPAMWFAPWRAQRAESCLTAVGYRVSYGRHAFAVSPDGLRAGTPQERAADLMEAVVDPDVDAILAAHSAVGSREIVPFLDAGTIAEHRKPFIGNCDNVFLHEFLAAHAGLSSYYGATYLEHFGEVGGAFPETVKYFTAATATNLPLACRPVPSRTRDWFNWYTKETEGEPRRRTVAGGRPPAKLSAGR